MELGRQLYTARGMCPMVGTMQQWFWRVRASAPGRIGAAKKAGSIPPLSREETAERAVCRGCPPEVQEKETLLEPGI